MRPDMTAVAHSGMWVLDAAGHVGDVERYFDGDDHAGWLAVCSCGWRYSAYGPLEKFPTLSAFLRHGMRDWRTHLVFAGTNDSNTAALKAAPLGDNEPYLSVIEPISGRRGPTGEEGAI